MATNLAVIPNDWGMNRFPNIFLDTINGEPAIRLERHIEGQDTNNAREVDGRWYKVKPGDHVVFKCLMKTEPSQLGDIDPASGARIGIDLWYSDAAPNWGTKNYILWGISSDTYRNPQNYAANVAHYVPFGTSQLTQRTIEFIVPDEFFSIDYLTGEQITPVKPNVVIVWAQAWSSTNGGTDPAKVWFTKSELYINPTAETPTAVFHHFEINGVIQTHNPLQFVVPASDVLVKAIYTAPAPPPTYTLVVTSTPITGVSVSIDINQYTTPTAPLSLQEGNHIVTVPASVSAGSAIYDFSTWEDSSTNRVRTVNITQDMTLAAAYTLRPPPTKVLIISSSAGGTTNPAPNSYAVPEGQTVQAVALPDANYIFNHWLLDGAQVATNPIVVLMNTDHSLNAVFEAVAPPVVVVTIKGMVTDATGPLEGVAVTTLGYATVTEDDGSYELANLPPAIYSISLQKEGYMQKTITVDASAEGTYLVDVVLTPVPPIPSENRNALYVALIIAAAVVGATVF